ncbi:MAG: glycerophosphodiester phosphodiesterase family protein [Actinobacteria bacterium]|nr:glycerophosphodiester phosphodiesterase family protein [Actinomycetota bacterium]
MFGQPRFADINSRINDAFAQAGTLIVAHRGTGHGSIADNTALAVKAALLSGADMVEIDVAASRDGEFFCFHDGYEPEVLGIDTNLQTLTAAEIDRVSHIWVDRPGRRAQVERLLPLLESFRGRTLFNIDRSWWRWPQLLRALRALGMTDQLILKCPAWEEAALSRLREFSVKFPFIPICASPDDVYRTVGDPELNTVGVELITTTSHHPWFSPEVIEEFHGLGVFCFINTETLTTGVPLFGGYDDELAIVEGPAAAFGPLFDLGVDAIQTDWPWLVRDYRATRRRQDGPEAATDIAAALSPAS